MHASLPPPAVVHRLEPLELRLPFWRYFELYRRRPYPFLLDSARDPETLGRFSFMGSDPSVVLKASRIAGAKGRARVDIDDRRCPSASVTFESADAFEEVRRLLAAHRVDVRDYAERAAPFLSGAVGYFGYEAGHFLEDLPERAAAEPALPDIYLMLHDAILVHCHRTRRSHLSVLGRGATAELARRNAELARGAARRRIDAFEADPPPAARPRDGAGRAPVTVRARFDEASYGRLVERAKEHIFAGDAFEVCLTQRMVADVDVDPWRLYQELRRHNPAPFASYLGLPEATVLSSSPERFLRLDDSGVAESRPIKGTRPRGATPDEDRKLADDLASSPKDGAENVMIVDLVRNDFGRVCRFGSVRVPELRQVESYATVHQLVSTVRGVLDEGQDGVGLLRACFPGGSMTGAPKIEAMKILARLEPLERGIYAGALGYIDHTGSLDLAIVIRTLVVTEGRCSFGVGGAIVADSDPTAEHRETLDKARAMVDALTSAAAGIEEAAPCGS